LEALFPVFGGKAGKIYNLRLRNIHMLFQRAPETQFLSLKILVRSAYWPIAFIVYEVVAEKPRFSILAGIKITTKLLCAGIDLSLFQAKRRGCRFCRNKRSSRPITHEKGFAEGVCRRSTRARAE
jgi:hypothetical protein